MTRSPDLRLLLLQQEDVDRATWEGMPPAAADSAPVADSPASPRGPAADDGPFDNEGTLRSHTALRLVDEGTLGVWALLDAATLGRNDATSLVKVRFIEKVGARGVSLLEIERNGVLSQSTNLRQALFYLRLQVVGSPVGHLNGSVERVHVVDFDGAAIGKQRQPGLCAGLAALLVAGSAQFRGQHTAPLPSA